jgi:hypothetical protein
MSGVDIYDIHPRDSASIIAVGLQYQRIKKSPLLQIETVYLVSGCREEGVAGGKVVCEGTPETGNARAVM